MDALTELLAVATEAAAVAVRPLVGEGVRDRVDGIAVEAMRLSLAGMPVDATVVVGEGEKDGAPMLAPGDRLGAGSGPALDLAVDPVDGTRAVAEGERGAMCVVAAAGRGRMRSLGDAYYAQRLAVPPAARGLVELDAPVEHTLGVIARALGKSITELTVAVMERPRNAPLAAEIRAAGARVRPFRFADLGATVAVGLPHVDVDASMGVSGAPECVLAAAALRCLGGDLLCRMLPGGSADASGPRETLPEILSAEDLVGGELVCFVATGVTPSVLLPGIDEAGAMTSLRLAMGAPPRQSCRRPRS